jgi:hypothetical protein
MVNSERGFYIGAAIALAILAVCHLVLHNWERAFTFCTMLLLCLRVVVLLKENK